MKLRSNSGQKIVQQWADALPAKASIIDIGAGSGQPLTTVLLDAGLNVYAIDASPTMITALNANLSPVKTACEAVEHSNFFDRKFDAALAVGLIFLLPEHTQKTVLEKIANTLNPRARFLFSAPRETGTWTDVLTGQSSTSLGAAAYAEILSDNNLEIVANHIDEGGSYYYDTRKKDT